MSQYARPDKWISLERILFGTALAVAIPACGYYGAKRSSSKLTCLYCTCSLLQGILQALSVMFAWREEYLLHVVVRHCTNETLQHANEEQCSDACKWCYFDFEDSVCNFDARCYSWTVYREHLFRTLVLVSFVVTIPMFVLSVLGFWWGKQLHGVLRDGQVLHEAP